MFRKLYDWTLTLAAKPSAEKWLGFISFADSSFFPIPPDVMLVPMCLARPDRAIRYATVCTITSVLGAVLGYAIGYFLYATVGQQIIEFYHAQAEMATFNAWIGDYGVWVILGFAFLPIPYKVATIAAGIAQLSLPIVIIASIIGRGGRFFLVAWLMQRYGVRAQEIIDNHFNKLAISAAVLFFGGIGLVKFVA